MTLEGKGHFHVEITRLTQHIFGELTLESLTLLGKLGVARLERRQVALSLALETLARSHKRSLRRPRQNISKTAPTYPTEVKVC